MYSHCVKQFNNFSKMKTELPKTYQSHTWLYSQGKLEHDLEETLLTAEPTSKAVYSTMLHPQAQANKITIDLEL